MATPGRPALLQPDSQFPEQAIQESIQVFPEPTNQTGNLVLTLQLASQADAIPPWGVTWQARDRELRKFWPTEPLLASTLPELALMNASYAWEIRHDSDAVVQAVTDILNSAMGRSEFGWIGYMQALMEDFYSQDNGCFTELIRDPGVDANSRFKEEAAPILGVAHLDASACIRTGNPEYPILYTDRESRQHKLKWYQVIPMSNFPSSLEKMNGVGYCTVTRLLRSAQIMRSIFLFKDEKISGRRFKSIHLVSGVSRTELEDAKKRGREEADNEGSLRYIDPVILASLDPEKPVSTATIDLASLPEGFSLDEEMRWYVTIVALAANTDYQTIAPLASGNLGSGSQSQILHRKSSGKSPIRKLFQAYKNYGVLPRGCEIILNDQNEEEELEKQMVRTKALEEAALSLRNGVLTPEAVRKDLVRRNIYTKETVADIPADYGNDIVAPKQNIGPIGGNTRLEDAKRTDSGAPKPAVGDRLQKLFGGRNAR